VVKDGKLCFLFKNKSNIYNGRGFEMLAALNAYCHPDSVANAFSSLLSILQSFRAMTSQFWHSALFLMALFENACCKVVIPPLLLVMLFLRALHSRYSDIVEQFQTQHKSLEMTSIEMIIADVTYHNEFILKEPLCQEKSSKPPS
jgi:hypothetical protein